MTFDPNESQLRHLEAELDKSHEQLPFWSVNPARGRFSLPAAFDSYHPMKMTVFSGGSVARAQQWRHLEAGLPIAMRWLNAKHSGPDEFEFDHSEMVAAGYFLNHAADYANLVDYFEMHSRGQIVADADAAQKRVRFRYPVSESGRRSLEGFVNNVAVFQRLQGELPSEGTPETNELLRTLDMMRVVVRGERFDLEDPYAATAPEMQQLVVRQWPRRAYQLDEQEDLGGFSVSALNSFWAATGAWSAACLRHQYRMHVQRTSLQLLPTQAVPQALFLDVVCAATQLSQGVVRQIIERLTYDASRSKAHIFTQPFLCSGGEIAWSPSVIMYSRFQRNMLKLMAQTSGLKGLADNLIGLRERQMLRDFGSLLAKRGWQYKLNQKLEGGEVDLLGYKNTAPEQVLIVQGKAVLAVDSVHEVASATKQFVEAQEQAERCARLLAAMPVGDKRRIYPFVAWDRVRYYHLLVVAPEAEPNEEVRFRPRPIRFARHGTNPAPLARLQEPGCTGQRLQGTDMAHNPVGCASQLL